MYGWRIEAAEEIQLLLPDDPPGPNHKGLMLVGLAVLAVALPCYGLRLIFSEPKAGRSVQP